MDKADDLADAITRKGHSYIRPVGRALLLSTFAEDGIRMFFQWGEQTTYIMHTWGTISLLAKLFVLFNLVCQLVPVGVLLSPLNKTFKKAAIGSLAAVMVVQTIAYTVLWNASFFLRNFAVSGALILLLAECLDDNVSRSMFAGVPDMGGIQRGDWLQASGRILVTFMVFTLVHFKRVTFVSLLFDLVAMVLAIMVALGFKTKTAALALVCLLQLENFTINDFYTEYTNSAQYDFKKYDFFQTETTIGGLLMVVALGPGGVSFDQGKKWE
mmetsp:Transcript_30674/g.80307  ORF Transcript_30674/g.80307 Transcript_30674/m.80307 type:complete len:270 (+) Transcript_30674:36-845(+)